MAALQILAIPSGIAVVCALPSRRIHRFHFVSIFLTRNIRHRRIPMAFPELHTFHRTHPGAYELQMGHSIARLVLLFAPVSADLESNGQTYRLASSPEYWSAAHAVFDEIRNRLLAAIKAKDRVREIQYYFEEACCQALYNATNPPDPFDPGSAYFVAPSAFAISQLHNIPEAQVVVALRANA
jgi:hypothetical protein